MPKRKDLKKVMVIGSGPIIIGQAAEFDYSGSQACRALKEEGIEVVLVNSNPATIMTDQNMADRVYIEPLTVDAVATILKKERPDGLLPTLGGQTGLNLAIALAEAGYLKEFEIELLGTPLETIRQAEDRQTFKELMDKIGEPVLNSRIAENIAEAREIAAEIGFPVIIRPAFTMGGTGGGLVEDVEQLEEVAVRGFKHSLIGQILIEKSIKGWKEIEYEVMRDQNDNCIIVCNMENFDPVGVHTGDSIVIAPSQTLSDREYQMLRSASLKIIRALGIEGGCNVQFALNPASFQYYVIEVNPRVSRSSALASKATGYPIAKVSARIALGYSLDEIANAVTRKTTACFEPALDYVVFKIPRWPFDKFHSADRGLGTQMKATGEVMAIERTVEGAMLKAVRSLEIGINGLYLESLAALTEQEIEQKLAAVDDERLFIIAEALRRGKKVDEIQRLTGISSFFIHKIKQIVRYEQKISSDLTPEILSEAKQLGFADRELATLSGKPEDQIRELRHRLGIKPVYKMVDTCAAEFEAETPYYYSTYEQTDESSVSEQAKVLVLGSGPIRIGQGIEFDYCSVHSAWALREEGLESIIVNNNPETVSTDFDTSDRLYLEPLTKEDVLNIIEQEKPAGVVVQFGGQTAINLAKPLFDQGVKILGTPVEAIDLAEDRDKFIALLRQLKIPCPEGYSASEPEEAAAIAAKIGYPVLIRPSYVLGGRAMEVVYNRSELIQYMQAANRVNPGYPLLIDQYLEGMEIEVDAISDGEDVFIPGIMEHIERAGVHSGDSIAVYPARQLDPNLKKTLIDYTIKLARALRIEGMVNIQFVITGGRVYVLEVNPRSSRTIPFLSKVTGVPMVKLATKAMLGRKLKDLGYRTGLLPEKTYQAVKVPVFSFSKLTEVDTGLGPEMKSTGEVMGIDNSYEKALYKGFVAAGINLPATGTILVTVADRDKEEVVNYIKEFTRLGFTIIATSGTATVLKAAGLPAEQVKKLSEGNPNIIDYLKENRINLVINTLNKGKKPASDGFKIRRYAVEMGIPCLTSLDTTRAVLNVLKSLKKGVPINCRALQDY